MAVPQLRWRISADLGGSSIVWKLPLPFAFVWKKAPGEMWARQLAWGTELLAIVV